MADSFSTALVAYPAAVAGVIALFKWLEFFEFRFDAVRESHGAIVVYDISLTLQLKRIEWLPREIHLYLTVKK